MFVKLVWESGASDYATVALLGVCGCYKTKRFVLNLTPENRL